MTTFYFRKGPVLVIIGLLIGAGAFPCICGNIDSNSVTEEVVIVYLDDQLDQYQIYFEPHSDITLSNEQYVSQSFKPNLTTFGSEDQWHWYYN